MTDIPSPFSKEEAIGILRGCFPDLDVRSLRMNLEGWDSVAVVVNEDWVFKVPRRREVIEDLEKELRLLPALGRVLPVSVPRPERVWRGTESPWLVLGYRWIPGEPLSPELVSRKGGEHLAAQLGRCLRDLHAFPRKDAVALGLHDADPATWLVGYRRLREDVRQEVFPVLELPMRERVGSAMESYLGSDAALDFEPSLVHCDLWPDHILCDPGGTRVNGVIDWSDALIGDPAIDFVGARRIGRGFLEKVLAAYGGRREGFLDRVEFHSKVVPLYELLHWRRTEALHARDSGLRDLALEFP